MRTASVTLEGRISGFERWAIEWPALVALLATMVGGGPAIVGTRSYRSSMWPSSASTYQIRANGALGPGWADWFGGMEILSQEDDETLLVGPVADQAALYGLLLSIRNLGLPLLSAVRIR